MEPQVEAEGKGRNTLHSALTLTRGSRLAVALLDGILCIQYGCIGSSHPLLFVTASVISVRFP